MCGIHCDLLSISFPALGDLQVQKVASQSMALFHHKGLCATTFECHLRQHHCGAFRYTETFGLSIAKSLAQ